MKKITLILLSLICAAFSQQEAHAERPSDHKVAIVAHRGFWNCEAAGYAQNSIASLKAAQDNGFWGSECDIHITADNRIIVNHDDTIGPEKLPISHSTYAQLAAYPLKNGEILPTFEQYCAQCVKCPTTVLVVEFKKQFNEEREALLVEKAFEILHEYGLDDPTKVAFISFSKFICRKLAAEHPTYANEYLNGEVSPRKAKKEGWSGIDYNYSVYNMHKGWIHECKRLSLVTNVWTVNSEKMLSKFISRGIDKITTNEPLLLRSLLGENEIQVK